MSQVRFIRVNGRVVPIRDKDPSKAKQERNYKKRGDAANQAAHIDSKYAAKAFNSSPAARNFSIAGAVGITGGVLAGGKKGLAAGGLGALAVVAGAIAGKRAEKRFAKAKEREYVRTFGVTSEGKRPMLKKPRK
jgi:hypothetical protein